MSTTATKLPVSLALAEAEAFKALFAGTYSRWEIAGSIRRQRPEIGDCEHVVMPIPTVGPNKVWSRLEELTADPESCFPQLGKQLQRAIYPDARYRWGPKYRGVILRDMRHEIFMADSDNWGCILAIRTGPAEAAPGLMNALRGRGHPHAEGYIVDGQSGQRIVCPDEETFFRLCGVPCLPPNRRG